MLYIILPALLLVLSLFIWLFHRGTSVRIKDEKIAIGFQAYPVTGRSQYQFSIKKVWIRPLHKFRLRCVVQIEVSEDNRHVRTHSLMMRNEKCADALIAKMEKALKINAG